MNGSENDLIGLQINDIKYKIPVGTGGEVGDGLINSVGDIEKELNYIHTDYGVEMATNVNYYVDSDVMVCKVMLTSLSGSILKLLTTTTIGVPRGSGYFVNFSTGKIGFYNGRSNNTQNIAYQRDCALTFVAGHQYVIEAIKREKRHYLKITDAYTLETDIYSVYPANSNELGEHWGKRSYEVAGSVTVQSFKNYSLEPYKSRLLVIGDSFVESFGTYPNRYVDIMKRLLNGSCAISGFGGATTEQVRTFYNDYCKTIFKPDYVLIAAGTNNSNYSTWLTAQQGLISDIKAAGSIPVLVTITRRLDNNNLSFMQQTNNWIRNTSGELYMDFNIITTLNYDGETQNTEMFSTDKVHPLASTHPLMVKRALLDVPEIFNLTGNYVKNRKELGGI